MKDKELKLNASGYYDEPCYKAVKTIDAPKPGEIWMHNQSGYNMLVVAVVGDVCSTLRLTDQPRNDSIPVMSKTPMYTTPIMLGYCFSHLLTQYVKTITDDEFTKVRLAVADALGLEDKPLPVTVTDDHIANLEDNVKVLCDRTVKLQEENSELKHDNADLRKECDALECEIQARETANTLLRESLEKVSREADKAGIYKEMYMTLLDKVISARGGSVSE